MALYGPDRGIYCRRTKPVPPLVESLDPQATSIVSVAIERLAEGNTSNVKSIGEGAELKISRVRAIGSISAGTARFSSSCSVAAPSGDNRTTSRLRFAAGETTRSANATRHENMPLTRSFRDTVRERAQRDPAFREALFQQAIEALLNGETDDGRVALRMYINATIGFERLGKVLRRPQKSLMRMFGPSGNPTAENLLGVIRALQKETGVHLEIRAVTEAA